MPIMPADGILQMLFRSVVFRADPFVFQLSPHRARQCSNGANTSANKKYISLASATLRLSRASACRDKFVHYLKRTHKADERPKYNGLLPALRRDFECRGEAYSLTLEPAILVGRDGVSTSYYPSADEDILETILGKIYLDDNPKSFDRHLRMTFTDG